MISEKINTADDLKKMLKPLERLMGYKTEFKRVFGKRGANITSAYQVMKAHLLSLAVGKTVKVGKKDGQSVQRATRVMTSVITSGALSKYFRDFAEGYLPLLNNWNIQLGKDPVVSTMVGASQRILDDMMTVKDANEVMRGATKKLRELLRYRPAAFDLSRHYLKSLQEDIEKKECSG